MIRLFRFLLSYKPGTAFFLIGGLLLFVFLALFSQYKTKGRVDVAAMIDRDSDLQPFLQRNPRLQYIDSFPNTSFLVVKDTQTGLSGMLDTNVVINAEVRPRACSGESALSSAILPAGAGHLVCFQIVKPDTGAGDNYIGAVSFQLSGKDSEVAQFYRELFASRQNKVTVIRESSRGIVLEAEDLHGNTSLRIAMRSSFQAVSGFLAWTRDFDSSVR